MDTSIRYRKENTYFNVDAEFIFPKEGDNVLTTWNDIFHHHEFAKIARIRIGIVLRL